MKLPFWAYAIGAVILLFIGIKIKHERELQELIDREERLIETAKGAGHAMSKKFHEQRRAQLKSKLEETRKLPMADRIRDSYNEYLRRRAEPYR